MARNARDPGPAPEGGALPRTPGGVAPDESSAKGTSILTEIRGGGAPEGAALGDLSAAPPARRRVPVQTLIVALVITASAGILFMMRRQAMGAGVRFNIQKIDYPLDKPPSSMSAEQQRLLAELDRSTAPIQIPSDRLQKNPFLLDAAGPTPGPQGEGPEAAARRLAEADRQQREAREADIKSAVAGVQVGSVMQGRIPLARLNGKTVKIGDKFGEFFTVVGIKDRTVQLQADGKVYEVSMGDAINLTDPDDYPPPPRLKPGPKGVSKSAPTTLPRR